MAVPELQELHGDLYYSSNKPVKVTDPSPLAPVIPGVRVLRRFFSFVHFKRPLIKFVLGLNKKNTADVMQKQLYLIFKMVTFILVKEMDDDGEKHIEKEKYAY